MEPWHLWENDSFFWVSRKWIRNVHLGGEVGSNERGDSLSKGNPRSSSPGNRIGWGEENTLRLMRVGSLLISINVKTKLAEALNIKISTNTFWTAIKWKVQVRRKNNICWFKLQVFYCDAKTLHVANLGAGQRSRKYNVTLPITEKHETHISQQWTLIIWPIHTHGLCWNLRVMLRVICRRELSSRWLVSYAWKHWNQLLGLWKFDTADEARNQGEMYYWKSYHPWFLKIGIQYRMWSCKLN